jgi:hypothetical protein
MLAQCWLNVGSMLAQRWLNIITILSQRCNSYIQRCLNVASSQRLEAFYLVMPAHPLFPPMRPGGCCARPPPPLPQHTTHTHTVKASLSYKRPWLSQRKGGGGGRGGDRRTIDFEKRTNFTAPQPEVVPPPSTQGLLRGLPRLRVPSPKHGSCRHRGGTVGDHSETHATGSLKNMYTLQARWHHQNITKLEKGDTHQQNITTRDTHRGTTDTDLNTTLSL